MRSFVLVVTLVLIGGGCAAQPGLGYRFDTGHDTEYRTIAVPVFENHTYEVGLEAELTEAVVKEIQRTTNWSVTSVSNADTVLTGVITAADMKILARSRATGLVEELLYSITLDFEWRDRSAGEPLTRRRGFTASGAFVPANQTGERIDVGRYAAVQAVARDIVAELRTNW